uniref:MAM domain-containing protein n=1 Tax=Strongyloides papillosus TaxID=174720 RepID=A0A0N5BC42_STREA
MKFFLKIYFITFIKIILGCLPPGGLYNPTYSYQYGAVPQSYYGASSLYYPHHRTAYRSQQAQSDTVLADDAGNLNCPSFSKKCKWSNTNEDELEWNILAASEEGLRQLSQLTSFTSAPDPDSAAVITTTGPRNGWESGYLLSDPIPCMKTPITITITAWRSSSNGINDQPQLQVCARNVGTTYAPTNCVPILFKNGITTTVEIQPPEEGNNGVQLVIIGNNFVAPQGSSLFIQDIQVDNANQECGEEHDVPANTIDDDGNALTKGSQTFNVKSAKYNVKQIVSKKSQSSTTVLDDICSTLSCNPAQSADCKWYTQGAQSWEKGQSSRRSNPLTGVQVSPFEGEKFLVASFNTRKPTSYVMSSEIVTIPRDLGRTLYYCFYEFINTYGSKISLCQDGEGTNCFYESENPKASDLLERNRQWNYKCVPLPIGQYEVYLIGQNSGENLGDIGFAASKVTTDAEGLNDIC